MERLSSFKGSAITPNIGTIGNIASDASASLRAQIYLALLSTYAYICILIKALNAYELKITCWVEMSDKTEE